MGKDSWVAKLDEEIPEDDCRDYERVFKPILKSYLLSNPESSPADMARKIDHFSRHDLLESEPPLRSQEDQGMHAFIGELFELVVILARLLPYDGPEQDKLIQVLVQLRKLPTREVRINSEAFLVWQTEPVLAPLLEDGWNANYRKLKRGFPRLILPMTLTLTGPKLATADRRKNGQKGVISFQELCDRWVNISSFLARCLEAGVLDLCENRLKYPGIDIPKGLEETWPDKLERDCKVTVAAQYILLAGRSVAQTCFKNPDKSSLNPESWKRWAAKLGEVSVEESGGTRLASMVKEAQKHMDSLTQELSA